MTILESAAFAGFDDKACVALEETLGWVQSSAVTESLFDRMADALSSDQGLAAVHAAELEERFGKERARSLYLLLALSQVPAALERRARAGIDADVTRRTFGDLGIWMRHFRRQIGLVGITFEILEWTQHYLKGDTVRFGPMQFDLVPFRGQIRVYRNRKTSTLAAVELRDGAETTALDLKRGETTSGRSTFDAAEWEVALEPGVPMIEMHLPAESFVTYRSVLRGLRRAHEHYAALRPDALPAGTFAEGWLHDPQIPEAIRNSELKKLQGLCKRYPASIPEAKTIRRIFGPDVTRADLPGIPADRLDNLQKVIAQFLEDPSHTLQARGIFSLGPEFRNVPEYLS